MRVLLADDHSLFLEGLSNLMVAHRFDVVGTASDGLEAVDKARALRPDLILMDIHMPRCSGLEATRVIKAEFPEMKIVMLTMSAEDNDLFDAVRSGASGYLVKSLGSAEFFASLAGMKAGEAPMGLGLTSKILDEFARQATVIPAAFAAPGGRDVRLNSRQLDVLSLAAEGLTYKEIGARVGISERTVKHTMAQIISRLRVQNRAQAIAFAERFGWTAGDGPRERRAGRL